MPSESAAKLRSHPVSPPWRRRFLVVAAATALLGMAGRSAGDAAPARTPNPTWDRTGRYAVTFDDEFNATSVDTATWEEGWYLGLGTSGVSQPVNSAEIACYDSNNVSEAGGYLHLRLAHVATTCQGTSHPYTGALVDTRLSFSQDGGAFEARVDIPATSTGSAVGWPAWWQVGNGPTWPRTGEIDTIEGLEGSTAIHLHYVDATGDPQGPGISVNPPQTGWHTFGEAWNQSTKTVTFYWDGVQRWTHAFDGTDPEYLIFTYTMASNSVPAPSSPSSMRVDWVRVWRARTPAGHPRAG